jgi:hypothetical protein
VPNKVWGDNMKRVLIGTPVRQDPEVLLLYLLSLNDLYKEGLDVAYYFIDDNDIEESRMLLRQFANDHTAKIDTFDVNDHYIKNEQTHLWNSQLIWKVANYKNMIIDYAVKEHFDYVFFADSDLVLQRETLQHLIKADKDIISEIFWTKWTPGTAELPQVWVQDIYSFIKKKDTFIKISDEEVKDLSWEFLQMLRSPGVFEVGGLGALTLIKREVFEKGVNFSEIKNVSFPGEDRHFCIRAVAYGYSLFVDTHYPAFHIYRKSELDNFR